MHIVNRKKHKLKKGLYKVFRTLQVELFFLQDARLIFVRFWRKISGNPIENDFKALPHIKGSDKMTFVDIGANRGETIQATQYFIKNAKIFAFEPNPIIFDRLLKRFMGNENIEVLNYGIGEVEENRDLFVPVYKKYMFDGLSSFYENEAREWLEGRLYNYNPKKLIIRKEQCRIKPLDAFQFSPDFIKIDVQGFEYNVLVGARETINRCLPIILIETPTTQVDEHLVSLGYHPIKFSEHGTFLHGHGGLNTFYFHSSKLELIPLEKE